MANLKFVPNNTSKSAASDLLTLEEIPDEVKSDAEEVYTMLKTNVGRMRVDFDTINELNKYESEIKAYCNLRPAGALYYRRSPARGLPKTSMEFRISDLKPKEDRDATTEAIRNGVDEVKTAAKTSK
jgi:hypothetical protein